MRAEALRAKRDIGRVRQLLVFDRLLARVGAVMGERVIVKGGMVLELRLERARTTKDIDLRVTGDADDLLRQLGVAAAHDLGDFLVFAVHSDPHHPTMEGEGVVYEADASGWSARSTASPTAPRSASTRASQTVS